MGVLRGSNARNAGLLNQKLEPRANRIQRGDAWYTPVVLRFLVRLHLRHPSDQVELRGWRPRGRVLLAPSPRLKDLLDRGSAIERLREQKGLSREVLTRGSGASYSYLSEVERPQEPSADVLAKLATVLDMLPSDLLRHIEESSAKRRNLLRKRVSEAPIHEHPGQVPESPAMRLDALAAPHERGSNPPRQIAAWR